MKNEYDGLVKFNTKTVNEHMRCKQLIEDLTNEVL